MKLIDRYIAEVGRHLPQKSRTDLENEIRSTLEDMLEDRSAETDKPVDEEMTVQILKEFGHPLKVAASYMPQRYLIGPQLFPYFIMVMKWALLVAFGIGLIRLSIGVIQAGVVVDAIVRSIVDGFLNMGNIAITILGNVVLIFGIMQWFMPNLKDIPFEWDPRSLPIINETAKTDTINVWDVTSTILFTSVAMLIFNFYPQILGMNFMMDGKWVFIPLLSENFFHYLPWFNILWALEVVYSIILLRQGRWQPVTRWFSIVVDALHIGMLFVLINAPSLVGLTAANLQAAGVENATGMLNLIHACVTLGLIVASIVLVIQLVIKIYRTLSGNRKLSLLTIP
jgi:hypothetical protein